MRELPRHRRRSTAMNFHTLIRPLFATATVSAFAVMLCLPLSAQTIDPDPELFDGTRTKKDQIQQDEKKKADKWEDANLILYDSNEQGSEQGGQGRVGGEGPGYAEGVQGGAGMQGGIPMPMMGGGGGQSDKQTIPGMTPTSQQSAQTQQGQGGPQSNSPGPGKPGEVSIGDPSQQIAASARPVSKVGGVPPPPTGEEVKESKGEDTTTIPSSASGQQSGQRGGGVEKGDAMPTDI